MGGDTQTLEVALAMTVAEAIAADAVISTKGQLEGSDPELKWCFGGQEIVDRSLTLADLGIEAGAIVRAHQPEANEKCPQSHTWADPQSDEAMCGSIVSMQLRVDPQVRPCMCTARPR